MLKALQIVQGWTSNTSRTSELPRCRRVQFLQGLEACAGLVGRSWLMQIQFQIRAWTDSGIHHDAGH